MAGLSEPRGGGVLPVYMRVAPADIAYLKFLFESYEEIGLVRTVDRHQAIIVVLIAEDYEADARAVVAELQATLGCEILERPPPDPDDWLMAELE